MSEDLERLKSRYINLCKEYVKRDGINELLDWLEHSDYFTAPASSKFHGSYEGGLLEHSLNVYDTLKSITSKYSHLNISEESIVICALFHDLCKANYYKSVTKRFKDPDTGVWLDKPGYEINEKFPIGHGEKSCIIIQWFLKQLTTDELLAIRYHMGGFDPIVKGGDFGMSKAYEACPLAIMLHLADMEATYLLESRTKEN